MIFHIFISDEAVEQNTFEVIRKCPKCGGNDMLTRKTKDGRFVQNVYLNGIPLLTSWLTYMD